MQFNSFTFSAFANTMQPGTRHTRLAANSTIPHELGQANLISDEDRDRLPAPIREFWEAASAEGDSYYPAIYRLSVQDQDTYALRITTDGDDGWLVIFGAEGNLLASAQTYIEVIIWADDSSLKSSSPANFLKTPLPGIETAASQTLWGQAIEG